MSKPKILAMYLPQYHSIPENDEFWGQGFTDWVTVKKAKPLFKGHCQPKIPMDDNYYDLSIKENIAWQAKLAKENGIDGFGIYHYWFNNEKNLLTKPAEIIKDNKDIDIDFFFAWDNANWKRSWSNVSGNDWAPMMENSKRKKGEPMILIPYILGDEKDWENHYNWLKPFFADRRYIKKDRKPLFVIFNYCEQIARMCAYWDDLAKRDGFEGMFFIFRYGKNYNIPEKENVFKYEPLFSGWSKPLPMYQRVLNKLSSIFCINSGPRKYDYIRIWDSILENARNMSQKELYHGSFVSYDDTPRRGKRGALVLGSTPGLFNRYMTELLKITEEQGKDFVFLTAWNEWGEGAYLEPDKINGSAYLEKINNIQKRKHE